MKTRTLFLIMLMVLGGSTYAVPELKLAGVFPKGTVYAKHIYRMRSKLKKDFKITIFPGGRAGNERQILALIQKGKIDIGSLTSAALGKAVPKIKVLDLPYTFRDRKHKARAVKKLLPDLKKSFEKKGLILVGWGSLGNIHLFTSTPVTTLNDFKDIKMWAPKGEPLVKSMYQEWGVVGVYSTIEGLLNNLQKKRITGYLAPSAGAIGLGWHRHSRYVTFPYVTTYSASMVISKASYDKLSKEQQKLLRKSLAKALDRTTRDSEKANKRSWKTLKRRGYKFVNMSKEMDANLRKNTKRITKKLVKMGICSKKFLKKVRKVRDRTI